MEILLSSYGTCWDCDCDALGKVVEYFGGKGGKQLFLEDLNVDNPLASDFDTMIAISANLECWYHSIILQQ